MELGIDVMSVRLEQRVVIEILTAEKVNSTDRKKLQFWTLPDTLR